MGKLIVIEGVDSSGKATQAALLKERLARGGERTRLISFPDYESDFSIPIKRYLAGELGDDPNDVNAYAASVFYAIDRFASYQKKWGEFYRSGGTVVADRYVTSNLVHQAAKLTEKKEEFIRWLSDLEYGKLGLPEPDLVIFLDMPPRYAIELMRERANKFTGGQRKDIHERNPRYLEESYQNAMEIAGLCGWHILSCVFGGRIREREELAGEIYRLVQEKN